MTARAENSAGGDAAAAAVQPEAAGRRGILRVLVIHNPEAGRRRSRRLEVVVARLRRLGAEVRVERTSASGDARRIAAAAACQSGPPLIAVAGGDGTINEVLNGVAGHDATIALVPLGTANVLAAEVGLPRNPRRIAALIASPDSRAIRVGEATTAQAARRFSVIAGIGFDAAVVANVSLPLKKRFGRFAYVLQVFVELLRYGPARFRIVADGRAYDCASAIIAKGRFYGGRVMVAPNASVDAGSFELVMFDTASRSAIVRCGLALLLGRLARRRDVSVVTARDIEVSGPAGTRFHVDGDPAGALPVRFTIADRPVHLKAPRVAG